MSLAFQRSVQTRSMVACVGVVPLVVLACGGGVDPDTHVRCAEDLASYYAARGWSAASLPPEGSAAEGDFLCNASGFGGLLAGKGVCGPYRSLELDRDGLERSALYARDGEPIAVFEGHACVAGPVDLRLEACETKGVGFTCLPEALQGEPPEGARREGPPATLVLPPFVALFL